MEMHSQLTPRPELVRILVTGLGLKEEDARFIVRRYRSAFLQELRYTYPFILFPPTILTSRAQQRKS